MAVVLRLSRAGTHKAPFYHVVATDSRKPRDGRYLEDVGDLRSDQQARADRAQGRADRALAQGRRAPEPDGRDDPEAGRRRRSPPRRRRRARDARPRPLARPRARREEGRRPGRGDRARSLDRARADASPPTISGASSAGAAGPRRRSGPCSTPPRGARGGARCSTSSTDVAGLVRIGKVVRAIGLKGYLGVAGIGGRARRGSARIVLPARGRAGAEAARIDGGAAAGARLGGEGRGRLRPDGGGAAGGRGGARAARGAAGARARGGTTGRTSRGCRW